ncbi:adenosylcobinamide-GDP ribazoletransferase [Roseisalinus antarcticus]|uniref:Adenosylcobinamide-GDP ribazoletransferase n=1 Tax=Roseisalinus antarcticus TaxID=254357 RepID=A0A1Y5SHC6_9RHOB|nr:adenosylcobinamide-GDP ribazoletransferase [Roseisalinus antarcticus]SLN40522.1 Cobalamin synthase [Roseisalinus antarcticus]
MRDKDRLFSAGDLGAAMALLTRLPAPGADHARGASAAWAWPLVGLLLGALAALGVQIALALGLPAGAAAALALALLAGLTGGLHQDGLADSADGLWGGRDRARRLEIMRDSRVGSYGVLAIALVLLLQWTALEGLVAAKAHWVALPLAGAASRATMAAVMAALPHARADGLARLTGRPAPRTAAAAAGLAALACLALAPATLPALALVALLSGLTVARLAMARLGGQTGDILGATQQLTELTALLAYAAVLT